MDSIENLLLVGSIVGNVGNMNKLNKKEVWIYRKPVDSLRSIEKQLKIGIEESIEDLCFWEKKSVDCNESIEK